MKNIWFPFIVFITSSSLFIAAAQGQLVGQSLNGVFAGTAGTPITFNLEWGCITSDPQATTFWDFGSGATPAKATTPYIYDGVISASLSQVVTYSTPGDKTFTLTTVSAGNSPFTATGTYGLHIYDCSTPSIPHDAIVINSDTTVALYNLKSSKTYWVNPGAIMNVTGGSGNDGICTIFAEPGATISGVGNCRLYMKNGSIFTSSTAYNSVIYCDGANINPHSLDFTLECPTLDFDYTNAPPNPAHPLSSVKDVIDASSITLSPNPTTGLISVKGLSPNIQSISVMNLLGETVIQLRNPQSPDFTLDLSKLAVGTYYIRFSSANSVVTKMVVRE